MRRVVQFPITLLHLQRLLHIREDVRLVSVEASTSHRLAGRVVLLLEGDMFDDLPEGAYPPYIRELPLEETSVEGT